MRRPISFGFAALLALGCATAAQIVGAAVLYQSGIPDDSGALDLAQASPVTVYFEPFSVSQSGRAGHIAFWVSQVASVGAAPAVDWYFASSNGQIPFRIENQGVATLTRTASAAANCCGGLVGYRYEFDVSLTVDVGALYWLGLHMPTSGYYWSQTSSPGPTGYRALPGRLAGGDPPTSVQVLNGTGVNLALEVSTGLPAVGTLALWSAALMGGLAVRRMSVPAAT